MASVSRGTQPGGAERHETLKTKVSTYDRVSGVLVALTVMLGFFSTLLFLLWLTTIDRTRPKPPPVEIQELMGRGEAAEGYARDLEEPGVEELPDVQEPQLAETLEAVTDAVSNVAATREAFAGDAAAVGKGAGEGDSRGIGPGGEGDLDVVPPWERWEVQYSTSSQQEYAKQLDFFQVELGALDKGTPRVDYASQLSGATPKKRIGSREDEKRLFFIPQKSELLAMDRALLTKAGIDLTGKYIVQFYPNGTLGSLLQQEQAALTGGRSLADVRRTLFGVRPAGDGYEYFVIQQDYIR